MAFDMSENENIDAPDGAMRGCPVVRLKPKAEARAIRHGFPWIYADELVTDRRTMALAPGALAVLEDGDRRPLGLVTVNTKSKIIARMLDRDPDAVIDKDWFAARLDRALDLRERVYDAPFYRWVHAEADGLPGIVIDRFGDLAVVQPNAAWAEMLIEPLTQAILAVPGMARVGEKRHGSFARTGRVERRNRCSGGRNFRSGAGADEWCGLYGRCLGRAKDRVVL